MRVTLPSVIPQTSQETSTLFHRVQKAMFLSCDWWISIHSVSFCFKMTVKIMIDSSINPNPMLGFELYSSHVIEKRYKLLHSTNCDSKLLFNNMVCMGHGKPGNSWNLSVDHGKSWKITENDFCYNNKARNIPQTNYRFHIILKTTS